MSIKDDFKKLIDPIIQSETDIANIQKLADWYTKIEEDQRAFARNSISNTKSNLKILNFSVYLSEMAYNEKQERHILTALILQSIEDFRWDPRENIIYLAIVWHVIQYLNLDAKTVFDKIISISSENAKSYLNEFYNRPAELKSLKAMGLKAVVKDSKILFEQNTPS